MNKVRRLLSSALISLSAAVMATSANSADSELKVGGTAEVENSGPSGAFLSATPGLNPSFVGTVPQGTKVRILEGPVNKDGYTWWRIQAPNGSAGWISQIWLVLPDAGGHSVRTSGASQKTLKPPSPSEVALCFLGRDRNLAIGRNFWTTMVDKAKTQAEINKVAGLWLGCAQADLENNHRDSAKVRLDEIVKVLTERKGDSLIIASAQFRLAVVELARQDWAEALTYAKSATKTFESQLGSTRPGHTRNWLDWGDYNDDPDERILALHVLARAYRVNHDPNWQAAIDKAIAIAEKTGRSHLHQTSLRLKKDLAGKRQ